MEAREFELMRGTEDHMWWYRAVHSNVISSLDRNVGAGESVLLDAGCGTGGLLRRLTKAKPGWILVGLDAAPQALARAVAGARARLVAGDINRIPFSDHSFHAIVSIDVLSHQAVEVDQALAELHRCLDAGGTLVLNLPAYEWMLSAHDRRVHNARRFTRRGAVKMLEAAGFRVIRATYWNTFLFPLMLLRRLISRGSEAESDVHAYPGLVERLFRFITGVEGRILEAGVNLPFGGSVLLVAVKQ